MINLTDDAGLVDERIDESSGESSMGLARSSAVCSERETSVSNDLGFAPRNSYSEVCWSCPGDFDGFEEFVNESRQQSGYGREPPPWW
jgi:hypothetical protein